MYSCSTLKIRGASPPAAGLPEQRIGGNAVGLTAGQLTEIVDELDRIEKDFSELESIIVSNASLTDRLQLTTNFKSRS